MHSCIYEGAVSHRRHEPVTHHFRYRLFMLYLDLAELPTLVGSRGLIGSSKNAGCSFLRGDHLFDKKRPLDEEVRELIRRETGATPCGRIRLLTQLRHFGYYFSPLNLFYVFDERDERVEYVVAEVSNTPWKERHCYVLWDGNRLVEAKDRSRTSWGSGSRQDFRLSSVNVESLGDFRDPKHDSDSSNSPNPLRFSHPKQFHVSPFMGMDMEYRWQLGEPASHLTAQLANFRNSKKRFDAGLSLRRRELTERQLRRMTLRYPVMTAQISAAIYLQALKLWWKKCPFYTHPKKTNNTQSQVATARKRLPAATIVAR